MCEWKDVYKWKVVSCVCVCVCLSGRMGVFFGIFLNGSMGVVYIRLDVVCACDCLNGRRVSYVYVCVWILCVYVCACMCTSI